MANVRFVEPAGDSLLRIIDSLSQALDLDLLVDSQQSDCSNVGLIRWQLSKMKIKTEENISVIMSFVNRCQTHLSKHLLSLFLARNLEGKQHSSSTDKIRLITRTPQMRKERIKVQFSGELTCFAVQTVFARQKPIKLLFVQKTFHQFPSA